jgi:hypothetical protein
MARIGKIARLPFSIREELNRRLLDGQAGPELIPWLNALPEVNEVIAKWFHGEKIKAQNLSDWRRGGYQDWLKERDSVHGMTLMAEKCIKIAKAGGGQISEGMAAIHGSILMGLVEELKQSTGPKGDKAPGLEERLALADKIGAAIAELRTGDQNDVRLEQNDARLKQKDEEIALARERFQRDMAETVLKSARDEAVQRIAAAPLDHSAQLNAVGKHLFGELWK